MLFLSPCAVTENVFAIKRVDRHVVLYPAVVEDGIPAVKQNLVLTKTQIKKCISMEEGFNSAPHLIRQHDQPTWT